jgi:ribosomal protein L37AE/L43A
MAEAIAKSKSKKKQEEDVGKRGNFGWPSGAFLYHLFSRLSAREREVRECVECAAEEATRQGCCNESAC